MSNLVNMQSAIRIRCKHAKLPIFTKKYLPGGTGVNFMVKFATPTLDYFEVPYFHELKDIIKFRIITKFSVINRALGLTFLGMKKSENRDMT